jgi:hypothetical protein
MDVWQEMRQAAQDVTAASPDSFADALNGFVRRFVGWPFTAASGFAVDEAGNQSDVFASVIHTTPAKDGTGGVPADGVAAVIDASESLDINGLRAAYARIAQVKRLKKKPTSRVPGAPPTTTITLGIVLAQRSDVPLDTLGEEIDRLNAATPGRERPDMFVVAPSGVINYGVQFPGESVTGDFLPPGEGALEAYTPPMYIVMLMRPSGDLSLNKMMAFLIAHLQMFSPGAKVPPWLDVLKGVPQNAVTLWGYQYNLVGDLVRVPREFYNDRYMAPLPIAIEDQKGSLLGLLRFLPWQDGAALLLEQSNLPLDGLLIFLDATALKRGGVMRLKNSQISYVLPITQRDFGQMLTRIQRQSNVVVRAIQPDWTVQKVADEGSSSPFMARLMIGMLRLRDNVFDPTNRDTFDTAYDFVLKSLFSARDAMHQMTKVWQEHEHKVASGQVARVDRNAIHVDESVDRGLSQEAEAFINAAARAIKKGMQDVAAVLGVNIGFLFQKQTAFEAGLAVLHTTDPALADYLRQARGVWSELLQDARNAVEHEGWTLPHVVYTRTAAGITATEPQIAGRPATEFASFIFDRLACFVEDVTAHLLLRKFPALIALAEIPLSERKDDVPERFRLTLANGPLPPWVISFHASTFAES